MKSTYVSITIPWFLFSVCLALEWTFPGLTQTYAYLPFLVSLLVLGMPHGAVDLHLYGTLSHASTYWDSLKQFSGFLLLTLPMLLLVVFSPSLALLLFALVTVFHFGMADERTIFHSAQPNNPIPCTSILFSINAVTRGILILASPFVFATDRSQALLLSMYHILGHDSAVLHPNLYAFFLGSLLVGILLFGSVVTYLIWNRLFSYVFLYSTELFLIVLLYSQLDPLFAMGLYFVGCHSLRHLLSIQQQLNVHSESASIWRLHLQSLPLLIPTLLTLSAYSSLSNQIHSLESFVLLMIWFFVIVTPGHHLFVETVLFSKAAQSAQSLQVDHEP